MNFIKQTIALRMHDDGKVFYQEIDAHVCGNYAYHKSVSPYNKRQKYNVTYIPTGMSLPIPIPHVYAIDTIKKAKQIIDVYKSEVGEIIPWKIWHYDYFDLDLYYLDLDKEIERIVQDRIHKIFKIEY